MGSDMTTSTRARIARPHSRCLRGKRTLQRSGAPRKLLTFVVVGAGPHRRRDGWPDRRARRSRSRGFRHIDSTKARVILLDAAPAVLPPMGEKLGHKAAARLEKLGVNPAQCDGDRRRPQWHHRQSTATERSSASKQPPRSGRQGCRQSPLERTSPTSVAPRSIAPVGSGLARPDGAGHPNVFVVGDMAFVDGVPGMAQGAIQGAVTPPNRSWLSSKAQTTRDRALQVLRQGLRMGSRAIRRSSRSGSWNSADSSPGFSAWLFPTSDLSGRLQGPADDETFGRHIH